MTKDEFRKFLDERAKETKEAKPTDWATRKKEWFRQLDRFYDMVDEFLAEFVKSGEIKIVPEKIFIEEQYIGAYEVASKVIYIGADKVWLKPIGTILIGSAGRVDMIGPFASVMFILTSKHSNGIKASIVAGDSGKARREKTPKPEAREELVWKIATQPPNVRFIEVDPETFFNALTKVVNGR